MIEVLAVVPARGGSKALPRKNLAMFGGRPLIAWTISAALGSQTITRTVVTTDDAEIANVAREYGAQVPFLRPPELAEDDTTGIAPILHAIRWLEVAEQYRPQIVINLQPTSPLRTSRDIDMALALLASNGVDAVVSVSAAADHPFWMKTVDSDGLMHNFLPQQSGVSRRQDLPPIYALNGAIYLAYREVILRNESWYTDRTAAYIMPRERSIDIDTLLDLRIAELLRSEAQP
jgi:N-acylneuraminate cytidylyltransferase/CMP-N,N'-diacetyllegionaminic acid synthase